MSNASSNATELAGAGGGGSIVCPQCGQENLPGTAFCENCGAQLPPPTPTAAPSVVQTVTPGQAAASGAAAATLVCTNCGYHNNADDKFCEQCGTALAGVAAQGDATAQEQPPSQPEVALPDDAQVDAPAISVPSDAEIAAPPLAELTAPVPTDLTQDDEATGSAADAQGVPEQAQASQPAPAETPPPPPAETAQPASAPPAPAEAAPLPAPVIPEPVAMTAAQMNEGAPPPQEAQVVQTCPNCDAALPANAKFCMNCGNKIEQQPVMVRPTHCTKCGSELAPSGKFCMECGTPVEMVPATSAAVTMPPVAQGTTSTPAANAAPASAPMQPAPQPVAPPPAQPASSPSPDITAPTPAARAYPASTGARLVSSDGKELAIKQQPELIVGREDPISGIHPDIDLTSFGGEAGGVSRRHAMLHFENGEWSVTDLDSTNYTRVNGNRIQPHTPTPLPDSAKVQFGRLDFDFHAS